MSFVRKFYRKVPEKSADAADTSLQETSTNEGVPERGSWSGRFDCLVSMINYAVGLGNVWRFPYLCFKNGGGAFLIPYLICWTFAAVPIFFMEVSLGQYLQEGGIGVWKLFPLFRGVGIANLLVASFCNIYYCVIVVWALYYMFSSFQSVLPWKSCNNSWNNERCVELDLKKNATEFLKMLFNRNLTKNDTQTPVEQFWERRALDTSAGIEDTGTVKWELALLLLLTWIVVYFALWRGITHAKKFIYFCALSPYVLIIILLIRGVTLPGAAEGIKFYLKPDLEKLKTATVWKDAGTQVFYSYGIGFGALMALGSYNKFNHNCYRDCIAMCCINGGTSFLAGFVIFSTLGYMAKVAEKTVAEVVKSGVGLVFLVYPEVVAIMPLSQLWSVLFFMMIFILGMDSQICTVEGVTTAVTDVFPKLLRSNKKLCLLIFCIINFFLGLPMVCRGGQYWVTVIDAFGASGITLLFIVFFEVVGISWGFGVNRLYKALQDMLGYRIFIGWKFAWLITAPLMCVVIFLLIVVKYEPLSYSNGVAYPGWAHALGFLMSSTSMIAIPIWAIYELATAPGVTLREKFSYATRSQMIAHRGTELQQIEHSSAQNDSTTNHNGPFEKQLDGNHAHSPEDPPPYDQVA